MTPDAMKRSAAAEAIRHVESGMTLGVGTGSTAAHFIDLLGEKVRAGLEVRGVPTSEDTRRRCEAAGVALVQPDETTVIDLAVDGTDEVAKAPDGGLDLIKGGGGALLREKIIAGAAKRFIVIADASKRVAELGKFPLPIEIDAFAYGLTVRRIREALAAEGLAGRLMLRQRSEGGAFLSDGGNLILDCALLRIHAAASLDARLRAIPGVVETGLFVGMAELVILGGPGGVETLREGSKEQ